MKARNWYARQEAQGGQTVFHRRGSGGYCVRAVMDPSGKRLEKRWALFRGNRRIWELQATISRTCALQAAEDWMKEMGIV